MAEKNVAAGQLGDLKQMNTALHQVNKLLVQLNQTLGKLQAPRSGVTTPSTTSAGTNASLMARSAPNGGGATFSGQQPNGGGGAGAPMFPTMGGGPPPTRGGIGSAQADMSGGGPSFTQFQHQSGPGGKYVNFAADVANKLGQYAPDWVQMDYTAQMYTRGHGGNEKQNARFWFGGKTGPGALYGWGTADRTQAMAQAEFLQGGIQGASSLSAAQQYIAPAAGASDVVGAALQFQSPQSEWARLSMGFGPGGTYRSQLKKYNGDQTAAMVGVTEAAMGRAWMGKNPSADALMAATQEGAPLGEYLATLGEDEREMTMRIIEAEAKVKRETGGKTIGQLGGIHSSQVKDILGEDSSKMLASAARHMESGRADRAGIMGVEGGIEALQSSMEKLAKTTDMMNEHAAGLFGFGGRLGGALMPWGRVTNDVLGFGSKIKGLFMGGEADAVGSGAGGLTFTEGGLYPSFSESGALGSLGSGGGGGGGGVSSNGGSSGGSNGDGGGAGDAPTGGSTGATGDNAKWIYQSLVGAGFSPQAAAGVIGNLTQESGVNPKISAGPSNGLMQWLDNGRWKELEKWAKGQNLDPWTLATQYAFMVKEIRDRGVWTSLAQKKDVHDATDFFEKKLEGAGKPMMSKRYGYADQAYKAFAGQSGNQRGRGDWYVDQAGDAQVHQGEMVLSKADADALRALTAGAAASRAIHIGAGAVTLNIGSGSVSEIKAAVDTFVKMLSEHPGVAGLGR